MRYNFTSVLLFVACVSLGNCGLLSNLFPRCAPADEKCIKNAIESSIKLMKDGLPLMDLAPVDPLNLGDLTIPYNNTYGYMKLKLKNATLHGLANLMVFSTTNDIVKGGVNLQAKILIPKIKLSSEDYKAEGYIMKFPVSGQGNCSVDFVKVVVNVNLENEKVVKNDKEFIQVNKFTLDISPQNIDFNLENLAAGNEYKGTVMNNMLNSIQEQVYTEMQPILQETLGEILKEFSNKFFLTFPYKDLFLLE